MGKVQHVMGKDLMIFVDSKAIALATSCKFTIKAEMQDAASKDSGVWDDKELGKLSYEGSSDSLFSNDTSATNAHMALVKAMIAGTALDIMFGLVSNPNTAGVPEGGWLPPTTGGYKGKAKITSVDFNAPNGDKATMAVSFAGCGALDVIEVSSNASVQATSVEPKTAPAAK